MIGPVLITDIKKTDLYNVEGKCTFLLFNQEIDVYVEDGSSIAYAETCVQYLNTMPNELITQLCEASLRYANDFNEAVGDEPLIVKKPTDILQHISPGSVIIPEPENENQPAFSLSLSCSWEEEHGLEWVIRDGKLMYVGAFEYMDPYGDCDIDSEYNYAGSMYTQIEKK